MAILGFLAPARAQEPTLPEGGIPGQTAPEQVRRPRANRTIREDYSRSSTGVGMSAKIGGQRISVRQSWERGTHKVRLPRDNRSGTYGVDRDAYGGYIDRSWQTEGSGSRDSYAGATYYDEREGRFLPVRR